MPRQNIPDDKLSGHKAPPTPKQPLSHTRGAGPDCDSAKNCCAAVSSWA